jgi:hypothetical protein
LLPFFLVVSQSGQAIGSATYADLWRVAAHVHRMRGGVPACVPGRDRAGPTFANIQYAGQSFSGIHDGGALEIVS